MSAFLDGVLGPAVAPEATHEVSGGPLKGTVSAQKALQGSENKTRELLIGTKENNILPYEGSLICPSKQINDFFYKKQTAKQT